MNPLADGLVRVAGLRFVGVHNSHLFLVASVLDTREVEYSAKISSKQPNWKPLRLPRSRALTV